MTKVTIHHDSVGGNLNIKIMLVRTAVVDLGFELHGKRYPALKLYPKDSKAYPYFVTGLAEATMDSFVAAVKEGCAELRIPHCAFDRPKINDMEAKEAMKDLSLKRYFAELPKTYLNTDAFVIFSEKEKITLGRKIFSPLWCRDHSGVVSLWSKTLPTFNKPSGVSKYQYFEAIIQNSAPADYTRPFWQVRR
jgi:hypothetical protein